MAGKGDKRRPMHIDIPLEEFDKNWNAIFQKNIILIKLKIMMK